MAEHDAPGGQDFEKGPQPGQNGVADAAPSPPPLPPPQTPQGPTGRRRTGAGAAPPPAPGTSGRSPGRPRGKAGDVPDEFDPNAPGAPKWSSHEVEVLWPELLQWLEAKGRSAYDVMVNVVRVEPPPKVCVGDPFEAAACVGDGTTTPHAALKFMVEEFYHLPLVRTPAKYELQFVWKNSGQYIVNGYLGCQSQPEIIALRVAQERRRMFTASQLPTQAPGLGGMPSHAPPQGQQPQQPQQPQQQQPQVQQPPPFGGYPYGYSAYAYPPPQPQPQTDPALERRLAALEEENRRLRAGQSIGVRPVPTGVGAPPQPQQPPLTATDIATAMATALKAVGFGAPQQDMVTGLRSALGLVKAIREFSDEVSSEFEPEHPEQPVPMLPAPAEVKPEDDNPYDVTEVPSQWDDGTKAKLVRDKETGKVDLVGLALYNPRPTQKLIEAGVAVLERFGKRGLGGTEEQPSQIEQTPEQQQLPPAQTPPSGDGSGGGGWGGF